MQAQKVRIIGRQIARYVGVLVVLVVMACAGDHRGIDGEITAPGVAASISLEERSFVGGRGMRITTIIDSLAGRYTVATCERWDGSTACEKATSRTGVIPSAQLQRLFADARAPAFRALRAEYLSSSTVIPPDFQTFSLTITASGRTRTIAWERGVVIPNSLSNYACTLSQARGDLLLCAFMPD